MNNEYYAAKALDYLNFLCSVKPNRRTGSAGNKAATDYFAKIIASFGYNLDQTTFPCLDFTASKAVLTIGNDTYPMHVSPFSLGCNIEATLEPVSSVEALEQCHGKDRILLLYGDLCKEQLMPKNFVFYNPDHHKRIYSLLESKAPQAIITATGKNPELVGGEYPFPMIEDGDFDIPSVYCTDALGEELAHYRGDTAHLFSDAKRIPETACNVIASKKGIQSEKILVCAHIDARGNTPGASDNAAGTAVLLLLAEMLKEYQGRFSLEIIAFNGEDYYSAGGQMDYLKRYRDRLSSIALAINIDDAGFVKGNSAYSFYACSEEEQKLVESIFSQHSSLLAGDQWYQGDHMIFAQQNRPTIAITSELMPELMAEFTHTPKDTPDIVDCNKLVAIALALKDLLLQY